MDGYINGENFDAYTKSYLILKYKNVDKSYVHVRPIFSCLVTYCIFYLPSYISLRQTCTDKAVITLISALRWWGVMNWNTHCSINVSLTQYIARHLAIVTIPGGHSYSEERYPPPYHPTHPLLCWPYINTHLNNHL